MARLSTARCARPGRRSAARTSWHLDATIEGDQRAAAFVERLGDAAWWETLLLWAALVERQSEERLAGVVEALADQGQPGLALVGMMMADGLGAEGACERWLGCWIAKLRRGWPAEVERGRKPGSCQRNNLGEGCASGLTTSEQG